MGLSYLDSSQRSDWILASRWLKLRGRNGAGWHSILITIASKVAWPQCLMHSLLQWCKYLLTPYADAISFCSRTPHPPDLLAESSLAIHPRSSSFHFHNSLHPVCVVRVPIRPSRALYYGLNGFRNSISRIIGLCLVALLLYWIVGSGFLSYVGKDWVLLIEIFPFVARSSFLDRPHVVELALHSVYIFHTAGYRISADITWPWVVWTFV